MCVCLCVSAPARKSCSILFWMMTRFKAKVGADLEDDKRRCRILRDTIGPENVLVMRGREGGGGLGGVSIKRFVRTSF